MSPQISAPLPDIKDPLAKNPAEAKTPGARLTEGRLLLTFDVSGDHAATRLCRSEQKPPLRVVRPFALPGGGALVHLHNVSGGVLGGDRLSMQVVLEESAHVQMTTTGSTRIYRHRQGTTAQQDTCCTIGRNALLEVLPDSLIPYAGSRFRQFTSYHLADGAGLLAWELVTPGREAHGERFAYDLLELHTTVVAGAMPLAVERMQLEPALRPLDSPLRLGRYGSLATFYACRMGQPPGDWAALEQLLAEVAERRSCVDECIWGASTLTQHGVIVRGLGRTQRHLAAGLPVFWSAARKFLYGEEGVLPRKLY